MTSGSKDGFIEYKLNSGQGFELDKKKMEIIIFILLKLKFIW